MTPIGEEIGHTLLPHHTSSPDWHSCHQLVRAGMLICCLLREALLASGCAKTKRLPTQTLTKTRPNEIIIDTWFLLFQGSCSHVKIFLMLHRNRPEDEVQICFTDLRGHIKYLLCCVVIGRDHKVCG